MTPSQVAAITDALLPHAAALVCGVHDHDAVAIHEAIDSLPDEHVRGLAVVLAALVPDTVNLPDMVAARNALRLPYEISPEMAERNRIRLADAIGAVDDYTPTREAS